MQEILCEVIADQINISFEMGFKEGVGDDKNDFRIEMALILRKDGIYDLSDILKICELSEKEFNDALKAKGSKSLTEQ
jgi:hypothetical protein